MVLKAVCHDPDQVEELHGAGAACHDDVGLNCIAADRCASHYKSLKTAFTLMSKKQSLEYCRRVCREDPTCLFFDMLGQTNSVLTGGWVFGGCFLTTCLPPDWSRVNGAEDDAAAALPATCPDFEEVKMETGYESYSEYYSCRVLPESTSGGDSEEPITTATTATAIAPGRDGGVGSGSPMPPPPPSPPSPSSSATSSSNEGGSDGSGGSGGGSVGGAVGATLGVIAGVCIIVAAVVLIRRRKSAGNGAGPFALHGGTAEAAPAAVPPPSLSAAAATATTNIFFASLLERAGQLLDRHHPMCTDRESGDSVVVVRKRIQLVKQNEVVAQGAFGPFCNGVLKPQSKGALFGAGGTPGAALALVVPCVDRPSTVAALAQTLLHWRISHPNLLQTLAVAHKSNNLFMMFETCKSSLRELLKAAKQTKSLLPERMQRNLCEEIASGMQHLETLCVVHGSLSPDCVYVAASTLQPAGVVDWTAKVGFGAEVGPGRREPLDPRRASPEDVAAQRATFKGDVFSFGVLAWEIFAFGATPYSSLAPEAIGAYLAKNLRLPKPKVLPEIEYETLQECWILDPAVRPKFEKVSAYYVLTRLPGSEDVLRAMRVAKSVPEEDTLAAAPAAALQPSPPPLPGNSAD